MTDLRYPIGKYRPPSEITEGQINDWIETIETFPTRLKSVLDSIEDSDLDKLHREGGWTIRQIVHHIADSHLNSIFRFKLALTEENPSIIAYDEVKWANLPDSASGDISASIDFIDALHRRWVTVLKNMNADDWNRTFYHSEMDRTIPLKWNVGLYAWHGDHHLAHIKQALDNNF